MRPTWSSSTTLSGGIRDFIGIFYSNNATKIGPVRSGRYFDEHITRMYHAFYVFNFADPREYRYFLGGDLATFMVVPGGNCSVAPFFTSRGELGYRRRLAL